MQRSYCRFFFFLVCYACSLAQVRAQDPQYSQYYAAPLFLNPAFTGAEQVTRIGFNYRNQWPGLDASFTTFSAYIDGYLDDYNSGIGLMFMQDTEGFVNLRSTSVGAFYAYELRLGEGMYFRPGASATFVQRDIGFFNNLVFSNQFNPDNPLDPNANLPDNGLDGIVEPVNFFTLGLGGLFYTERFWAGVSVHHLNTPNQSFLNDTPGDFANLPRRISLHAGYKIPLRINNYRRDFTHLQKEYYIVPTVHYQNQGPFEQLDIGTYAYLEPLTIGLWYRGLPFRPVEQQSNRDAVVMMVGVNLPSGFSFGYSFDYTVSRLGIQTGGAHEISVSLLLGDRNVPRKKGKETILPCPRF